MKGVKGNAVMLKSVMDKGQALSRIEAVANDKWDEKWLQRLIFDHPELLPVNEFDPEIGELVPLAREINTASGPIDALFVSTTARLVIVETKLWKNPQKHREVVAQIIDYAHRLATWDYTELEQAVLKSIRSPIGDGQSFEKLLAPALKRKGLDFVQFQEQLIDCMRSGQFLLLIVGDRISPNVALLSKAIHGAPGLAFQFGLVELNIFALDTLKEGSMLVVSDVVGRTVEETRAIVKLQLEPNAPRPEITVPSTVSEKTTRGKVNIELLTPQLPQEMRKSFSKWAEEWKARGYHFSHGTVGVAFHMPIREKTASLFEVYPHTISGLTRKRIGSLIKDADIQEYMNAVKQAPTVFSRLNAGKPYINLKRLPLEEFNILMRANLAIADAVVQRNKNL